MPIHGRNERSRQRDQTLRSLAGLIVRIASSHGHTIPADRFRKVARRVIAAVERMLQAIRSGSQRVVHRGYPQSVKGLTSSSYVGAVCVGADYEHQLFALWRARSTSASEPGTTLE